MHSTVKENGKCYKFVVTNARTVSKYAVKLVSEIASSWHMLFVGLCYVYLGTKVIFLSFLT